MAEESFRSPKNLLLLRFREHLLLWHHITSSLFHNWRTDKTYRFPTSWVWRFLVTRGSSEFLDKDKVVLISESRSSNSASEWFLYFQIAHSKQNPLLQMNYYPALQSCSTKVWMNFLMLRVSLQTFKCLIIFDTRCSIFGRKIPQPK